MSLKKFRCQFALNKTCEINLKSQLELHNQKCVFVINKLCFFNKNDSDKQFEIYPKKKKKSQTI